MSVSVVDRKWLNESFEVDSGRARSFGEYIPLLCTCWSIGFLAIGYWIPTADSASRQEVGRFVQFLAAIIATLPVLFRLIQGAWENSSEVYTDQLVVLAIFGALATGEYSTAVLVPAILDLGHFIEQRSIQGTRAAIDGIQRLDARPVTITDETGERNVLPAALRIGQIMLVRPGELIAADGLVLSGRSSIDESMITGESYPREAALNDPVPAGAIALDGVLQIKVTGVGDQTSLGKIRGMLDQALQSKAPVTKLLERYAELYVPVVLLIAGLSLLLTRDMQRVIAIFVVSCPCALVLSGPAPMIAALACAARQGILIKNARFLESLAESDTVIFDKTGTITEGLHEVLRVIPAPGICVSELLVDLFHCTSSSIHPISRSIAAYCKSSGVEHPTGPQPKVTNLPGRGVEVVMAGRILRLGQAAWLTELGVHLPKLIAHPGPMVCVSSHDQFLGCVLMQDRLRPETAQVMQDLRGMGIGRMILLTGDRSSVAAAVADQLPFDEVIADALPEEKLNVVHKEVAEGRTVLVIGDGVNDALALAAGTVSIAMGARGAELAIRSADIALMTNDLRRIVSAVKLSRRTRKTIQQNVLLAAGSAMVMLALGLTGLMPALLGSILHNIGTVGVLINSARVLRADG